LLSFSFYRCYHDSTPPFPLPEHIEHLKLVGHNENSIQKNQKIPNAIFLNQQNRPDV
jgi:hypothetical protein